MIDEHTKGVEQLSELLLIWQEIQEFHLELPGDITGIPSALVSALSIIVVAGQEHLEETIVNYYPQLRILTWLYGPEFRQLPHSQLQERSTALRSIVQTRRRPGIKPLERAEMGCCHGKRLERFIGYTITSNCVTEWTDCLKD